MQQDDADRAVRDLLEAVADRLDLRSRLGVDAPQQRLAEVGQRGAGEPADESLRPHDTDLASCKFERGRRAVEHVHACVPQDSRDLVAATAVQVVVAEHGADRPAQPCAGVREQPCLLRLAERGQVAGEQEHVDLRLDAPERGRETVACLRAAMDVAGGGDADRPRHRLNSSAGILVPPGRVRRRRAA